MRLLPVLTTLAAAIVPGCLTSADMSCSCRLWHHRDTSINLHCSRAQGGASKVSCATAEVPDIPHGYHYIPGYALVRLYRAMRSWADSKKACESEGAQLAVPRDQHAFDGLKQIFSKEKGVGWGNLGISDQLSDGLYVGLDGRSVSLIPWKPGQPDNAEGKEHCVDFNADGVSHDVNCAHAAPYFCERRLPASIPEGYGWVGDAGRFYKVHSEKRAYAEAASACKAENARLAVTDTWRRTEALLKRFDLDEPDIYQTYLVGFTDQANEGDFVTETGKHMRDMEYQNWLPNEPNNSDENGKAENCVALSKRGYYYDVSCDRQLPFICEIAV